MLLWDPRKKSKSMFYVGESSVLEVDGTLKSNLLGVVFDTCSGSGLEDDILMGFDDFGLHLGVPVEIILGQVWCLGGLLFDVFLAGQV